MQLLEITKKLDLLQVYLYYNQLKPFDLTHVTSKLNWLIQSHLTRTIFKNNKSRKFPRQMNTFYKV